MIINIYLFIIGLAIGSFINALVWRIYMQEFNFESGHKKNKKLKNSTHTQQKASKKNLSIVSGRSMCPECQHTLFWKDLLPLISWLSLRGKCRYCKKPISVQYPLIELLTAILFVVSFVVWPYGFDALGIFDFAVWLALLAGLVGLLVFDFKWLILPNRILYPLFYLTVVWLIVRTLFFSGVAFSELGLTLLASLLLGGFYLFLYVGSRGKWVGFGDVRLGFLLGLVVGTPFGSFLVVFLASVIGTVYSLPGLLIKKNSLTAKIPFGPFLIVATFFVVLGWPWFIRVAQQLMIV